MSTVVDTLRHRRISVIGHVARLDPVVPAYDTPHLTVNMYAAESQRLAGEDLLASIITWLKHVQKDVDAIYRCLCCRDLVPPSCTTSFGRRSFGSSGSTAWNDMPAHLCNSDLTLTDFRHC